jgi:hypothetical protein
MQYDLIISLNLPPLHFSPFSLANRKHRLIFLQQPLSRLFTYSSSLARDYPGASDQDRGSPTCSYRQRRLCTQRLDSTQTCTDYRFALGITSSALAMAQGEQSSIAGTRSCLTFAVVSVAS